MGVQIEHKGGREKILAAFHERANFVALTQRGKEVKIVTTEITSPFKGRLSVPSYSPMKGIMYARVELSRLKTAGRLSEQDVIAELSRLASVGHLGITNLFIKPSNILFCATTGEASVAGRNIKDTPHVHRSYNTHPLSKGERAKGSFILDVIEEVRKRREEHTKDTSRVHGKGSGELELQFLREDREAAREQHALLVAIAEELRAEERG